MSDDFGLLLRNGASDVQIDSSTRQLQPFFDSVVAFPDRPSNGPAQVQPIRQTIVNFPSRANTPFVFHQGRQNAFVTAPRIFTNSAGRVTGVALNVESDPITLTGISVRVVLADGDGDLRRDSSDWGLMVRNATGQKVYDSRDGVLTVIDVIDVSMSLPFPGSGGYSGQPPHIDVAHAWDQNAFYMLSSMNGIATQWRGFDGLIYRPGVRKLSNSSARLTWTHSQWGSLTYSLPEVWAGLPFAGRLLVARLEYAD